MDEETVQATNHQPYLKAEKAALEKEAEQAEYAGQAEQLNKLNTLPII